MIYTIKNDHLTAQINSLGAELISVQNNDGKEYIFQPSEIWVGQSKNLFPNIALAKDNYTIIRGKQYPMNQHGFLKNMEMEVVSQSADSIAFKLTDNAETAQFVPYKFTVIIEFEVVDDTVIQTYKVSNHEDEAMYFGIGCHTGFATAPDSFVDFGTNNNITELIRENMQYMTGETKPYPLENGKIFVTPKYFSDGAHILEGFDNKELTLINPSLESSVKINFADFTYITLWSTTDAETVLCMMPWCALPDAIDSTHIFEEKKGNVMLEGHKIFIAKQVFTFNDL
ncbi:aldose 1-epimerase family protein [Candidatus Epulonipiscium viviparus]|uniref:aldose 1-epimerase family protein n=1 Tax=Candidatus Epulonipiscium viviparus TaxID=420336 RepID=UPI00016C0A23|nr:aldose 1-epimerase family protein [Candidatus Epulopiscium viviparus]